MNADVWSGFVQIQVCWWISNWGIQADAEIEKTFPMVRAK
jgi:hypothetical protein